MTITMENILFKEYSYENTYNCSPVAQSKHFNKLMYLLSHINILQKKHSDIDIKKVITNYIINNPQEINQKNNGGWTAL